MLIKIKFNQLKIQIFKFLNLFKINYQTTVKLLIRKIRNKI